ncbi:hypothetical protein AB688_22805 [Pseudomonas putida]|nr:hypothetical protein AB688_22805 [Pseudomonas putida]
MPQWRPPGFCQQRLTSRTTNCAQRPGIWTSRPACRSRRSSTCTTGRWGCTRRSRINVRSIRKPVTSSPSSH